MFSMIGPKSMNTTALQRVCDRTPRLSMYLSRDEHGSLELGRLLIAA